MFGSHLSISGGMHNAVLSAEKLGCTCVQVFTKNQQQWAAKPLTDLAIADWKRELKRVRLKKTVSHDSYLINLAAPGEELWRKSILAFADELTRCGQLGIPYLVTHPGAHMGTGEDVGLARVALGLDVVHDMVPPDGVVTCLEITAGQGSSLGYKLEHLAEILSRVKAPERLAVCLDTAHLFAAGYDFRKPRQYDALWKQIGKTVGLRRVKVLHANDSKKALGSRVDRHAHIGHGEIGLDGFKPWVRDEAWKNVPKILETAKEKHESGREWDEVNPETLRGLVR